MDGPDGRVAVPDLLGLPVPVARDAGHDAAVVVVADLDGPPLGAVTWPGMYVVTAQEPQPGSRVDRWDVVRIWFRRTDGDEAGDREPRLPPPSPDVLGVHAATDGEQGPAPRGSVPQ